MRTYELAKLTWKEAEEALAQKPVVLVPIGAVEPHGPQLPLGTDYMVAEYVAHEAAKAVGDAALVTPAIPFGYCDMVQNVPGAISLDPNTLVAIVRDIVQNLVRHGVEKIIFVNNHRTNAVALNYIGRKLREELNVEMAAFFPWGVIQAFCPPMYENFAAVFGHGGEPETSVAQYLFPEHVRMDLAVRDQYGPIWGIKTKGPSQLDFQGIPIEVYLQSEDVTETGTKGDPFAASAERGKEMIEKAIGYLADFIKVFRDVPVQAKKAAQV